MTRFVKKGNPLPLIIGTDFLVSVTLLLILVSGALWKYSETRRMVVVSAGVAEASNNLKVDMSTYYALYGEWPNHYDALTELFPERREYYEDLASLETGYSKYEHTIDSGAIDVQLKWEEGKNVVTLRPAVPSEDPLGPVLWVAGSNGRAGWKTAGEDHSTVEEKYISSDLK